MLSKIIYVAKNKYFYLLLAIVLIVPIVYEKLPVRIDITQQSSLPQKVWITYSNLDIEAEYMLFKPSKNKYIKDRTLYLKKIACKEGDYLVVKDREFFCNGVYLGTASEFDGNKNKVDMFIFNGEIPKNKFFVVGTHTLSHDSKYFGFVDISQVVRKAKPFFVE